MSDSILDTSYLKLAFPFFISESQRNSHFCPFTCIPHPLISSVLLFTSGDTLPRHTLPHAVSYFRSLQSRGLSLLHPTKNMHVHKPHKHSEWFVFYFSTPVAHDKNSCESLRPRALWECGDSVHESDTFHCASAARKANRQLRSRFSRSDGRLKSGSHPSGVQNHWRCFWPRGPFPWSASWELWLLACFVRRALFVNGMGTEVGKTVSSFAWRKPQWMESSTAGRACSALKYYVIMRVQACLI